MVTVSPLGPIDPDSLRAAEEEKHTPWVMRKLVGVRALLHRGSPRVVDVICCSRGPAGS
jgi:hypothetical protein